MSTMHVLDRSGDRVIEWDVTDQPTVDTAIQAFEAHLAAGGAVIRTQPGPEQQIRTFDPQAEQLVAIPQIVGG